MTLHSFNRADACDQTCSFCAREWWAWLRARESQMSTPMESKLALRNQPGSQSYYVKHGSKTSWSEAAATSVVLRTQCLKGSTVLCVDHPEWGNFLCVHDTGCVGGDRRHWVGLQKDDWLFHVERSMVKVVV